MANGAYINYTKEDILNAAETSLIRRGNGTGPDADAGWEKVWRAAAWAQLGNATEFYKELTVHAIPYLGLHLADSPFPVRHTEELRAQLVFFVYLRIDYLPDRREFWLPRRSSGASTHIPMPQNVHGLY